MVSQSFVSTFFCRRFKFSRSRRRLQSSVRQAAARAVRWSFGGSCLCFSRSCNDSKMSSSWRLLEATPDLLEQFSQSLNSVEDLTQALEQNGLISGGDIVDHAEINSRVDSSSDIRELVKRFVIKDEDTFVRLKRTLVENGEYDALEVLSNVPLPDDHQLLQQQQQDQTPEPPLQITADDQMPPRDQSELSASLQRSACVPPPDSDLPTKQGNSAQEEEVDAKPSMSAASTSAAAAATLPSMVTVRRAEKITTGSQIYKLTDNPRGICLIFNNRTFPSMPGKDRPGSELDLQRMQILFEEFKFQVHTFVDQPSYMILGLLDTFAHEEVVDGHQAFVVILMSHGELNHIYGNDYNQVKLQDIFEKFNNANCPKLRERPKMFFIQACRGDQPDNGTVGRNPITECFGDDGVQSDAGVFVGRSHSGSGDAMKPQERRISSWSDMYIAYAVVEGYESLRDLNTGSWFMKAVFDVMAHKAHNQDLDTLMEYVSERVLERARVDGQRQCPEVKKIGWRKKLFFNPGLSE